MEHLNKKKRTQKLFLFSNVPPVERVVDVLPETGNDGTPTHMWNPPLMDVLNIEEGTYEWQRILNRVVDRRWIEVDRVSDAIELSVGVKRWPRRDSE